jgi:hypothetical protein
VYGCYSLWPDGDTERILRVKLEPTATGDEWRMETLRVPAYGPDLTPDMIASWTVPDLDGFPDFEGAIRNGNLDAFEDYVTTHFEAGEHMGPRWNLDNPDLDAQKATPNELISGMIGNNADPRFIR